MPYIAAKQQQHRVRLLAERRLVELQYKVIPLSGYLFHLEARKGPLTLWVHVTPSPPSAELRKALDRELVGEGEKKELWIRDYDTKGGFKIINIQTCQERKTPHIEPKQPRI